MSKKKKPKKTQGNSLNHRILEVFRKDPTQSFNYKQVSKRLDVKQTSKRKLIGKILYELFDKGHLIEEKPGRFKLEPSAANLQTMVGKVDMTQSGIAYIEVEGLPDDIYISEQNIGTALHGDLVEVSLAKVKRNGKPIGKIEKVVERAMTDFVGTIEKSLKYAFLVPDSKRMPVDIFIPLSKLNGAENGEKAIARMTDWPSDADSPFGEIIQVLGKPGENETEMHAILAEYGLPAKFPKEIVEEAEKIDTAIKASEIKKRRDMRNVTTFTIDPLDAKDFDDALSVRKLKNGNWEIGVHIADVSHYLKEGSTLDQEAFDRATSVYLVDRVVPMLPEVLSNFACSLRPDEEKYCFSAIFEIDENTKLINEWFGRTVIKSDKRFAYEDAQKIIESGEGDFAEEILTLDGLAKQMRKDRFKKGAIDFHTLEVKFELDEKGEPLGVFIKEQKDANKLIEEFMLLANKRVATFIGSKQKRLPFVYRIHANPDPEKLQTFSEFIKKFGYRIDTTSPKGITSTINRLMNDITGKAEEQLISQLAIRTMAKAEYSTENIGHYGLGFHYYSHFTSPIRRYPDVMVHRLLQHYLDGGNAVNQEELEEKCKHSSEREKLATDAERASIKFMQVKFMQGKEGEIFAGVVSGVSDFGLFVELEESKCEGLIRLKSLTDDYYTFNPDNFALEGKRTGKVYRIGDELTVKVLKADLAKKQLDFELMSDINV
ncbi:MAG: ribonuclease R [Flavobacteriales bacterium]|nr:ribonuclease R [Flavobacteriales bacterium]|tara:strand:- start:41237 stop:43381 length:2145 start_codon:yes stop_codon:yes gene_type:complete